MSEPHMEPPAPQSPDQPGSAEENISLDGAIQDLERQQAMIRAESEDKASVSPSVDTTRDNMKPVSAALSGVDLPNLQFVLDIPLQVTVELGRKRLLVHDLLQLSQGSVIELSKQIGEPFEVLINQKLIARGEIVVINDKFGVRITDIISPMERVQQLQ